MQSGVPALTSALSTVPVLPRVLFVAWQNPHNRAIYPIARMVQFAAAPRYEFSYVRGVLDAQREGFEPFRELANLHEVYRFEDLPPLFTNRVMPASRLDFADHVERLALTNGASGVPEPVLLLARSEGRKVTDNLEITATPEFDPSTRSWIYHGFVRGVRHLAGAEEAIHSLHAGDLLRIERDGTNDWDARALLVLRRDKQRLGYVPHILVEDFGWFLDLGRAVQAEVVRVNRPPAPVHQRVLVAFRVEHQPGFVPMSTPRFAPLTASATLLDLAAAADLRPA